MACKRKADFKLRQVVSELCGKTEEQALECEKAKLKVIFDEMFITIVSSSERLGRALSDGTKCVIAAHRERKGVEKIIHEVQVKLTGERKGLRSLEGKKDRGTIEKNLKKWRTKASAASCIGNHADRKRQLDVCNEKVKRLENMRVERNRAILQAKRKIAEYVEQLRDVRKRRDDISVTSKEYIWNSFCEWYDREKAPEGRCQVCTTEGAVYMSGSREPRRYCRLCKCKAFYQGQGWTTSEFSRFLSRRMEESDLNGMEKIDMIELLANELSERLTTESPRCRYTGVDIGWSSGLHVDFDHVLSKADYPDFALDPRNIVPVWDGINRLKLDTDPGQFADYLEVIYGGQLDQHRETIDFLQQVDRLLKSEGPEAVMKHLDAWTSSVPLSSDEI